MLAGLFKAPTKYAPHVNLPAARARANEVLTNMVEAGFLTEGQVLTARGAIRRRRSTARRETTPDYFLDWAFEEVKQLAADRQARQRPRPDRHHAPRPRAAVACRETLEDMLRQYGKQYDVDQGAMVVIDADGAVRAMVGGTRLRQEPVQPRHRRAAPAGLVLQALRLRGGADDQPEAAPTSIVIDGPICIGNWCPQNYGRSFSGSDAADLALARSINSIPVRMSLEIGKGNAKAGRAKIIDIGLKMGLTHPLTDSISLPIGGADGQRARIGQRMRQAHLAGDVDDLGATGLGVALADLQGHPDRDRVDRPGERRGQRHAAGERPAVVLRTPIADADRPCR